MDVEVEANARALKEADVKLDTSLVLPSVEEEPSRKEGEQEPVKPGRSAKKSTRQSKKISIDFEGEALFAPGSPPTKEETMKMLEEAKQMVEAANEKEATPDTTDASADASADVSDAPEDAPLANGVADSKKSKRKVTDISAADEADKEKDGEAGESDEPSAKKVKTEIERRKETVRRRALYGISATVAMG